MDEVILLAIALVCNLWGIVSLKKLGEIGTKKVIQSLIGSALILAVLLIGKAYLYLIYYRIL